MTTFEDKQPHRIVVRRRKDPTQCLPYWCTQPITSDRTIWLEHDQVVEYCPNAEAYVWLRSAKRLGTYLGACCLVMMAANCWYNFLTPTYLFLGKTLLLPLKSVLFVSGAPPGHLFFGFLSYIAQAVLIAMGLGFAFLTTANALRPTHLGLTGDAICVVRRLMDDNYQELKYIPHHEIKEVRIVRPQGKRSVRDYEIDIINHDGDVMLTTRYGDIVFPEERERLLSWIQQNVKDFDAEMLTVFKPPSERQSYTELWLQELSAPPKRDKLTPLSPGATVNQQKYNILSKLGVGGQGTVYLACSANGTSSSEVVLKEFVLPIYPDPRVRRQAAEKFQEEAELLSRLDHPRIVHFLDLFIEDHRAYLVLEKVEGRTLEELVEEQGKQSEKYVLSLAVKMCDILDYLHSMEPPIVHRDFTPDNLILEPDGNLKLIDFSVAQRLESNITGSVVGKPNFIAPEQFRGKPTVQSDIYSMAATLYFLVTGLRPDPISRLFPSRIDDKVSNDFDTVIAHATHLDCAKRYQSIKDMHADLQRICERKAKNY